MLYPHRMKNPRCTGNEPFTSDGTELPFRLQDFWRWSASDLLSNALRGVLAEFIVARALGIDDDGVRSEWDAVDLRMPDGLTIEVKSAAYLQSWQQPRPSAIRFDIGPAKAPWDARTNATGAPGRTADVYVFCLFTEREQARANPLDLDQWEFRVLPTRMLDDRVGTQKTIGLAGLARLGAVPCRYAVLKAAVGQARITPRCGTFTTGGRT
ncbi:MAG: hypothetical protein M0R80_25900 [Proteobacteria bacterium]|nr:hypothetical protein [Pseudomonadota bacterium]